MGCRSSSPASDKDSSQTKELKANEGDYTNVEATTSTALPSKAKESDKKVLKKQLTVVRFENDPDSPSRPNGDGPARHLEKSASTDSLSSVSQAGDEDEKPRESRGSFQIVTPKTGQRKVLQRGFSMASEIDGREKKRLSQEKAFEQTGVEDPEEHGIYVTCRRGAKDRRVPNQDSWSVLKTKTHAIYGVYDGHGRKGHDVSNLVKKHLPQLVESDTRFVTNDPLHALLHDAFGEMESLIDTAYEDGEIDAKSSGTTATLVIHDLVQSKLTVAHVGDSGAVLARAGNVDTLYLTPDHTPDRPEETARIEKSGGRVQFDGNSHRVYKVGEHYPALNMSRAFGDMRGRDAGIISIPDVAEIELRDTDEFFVICSDGVWEFIKAKEASEICHQAFITGENPAKELAVEALSRWREYAGGVVDDITCVFVNLSLKSEAPEKLERSTTQDLDSEPGDSFCAQREKPLVMPLAMKKGCSWNKV